MLMSLCLITRDKAKPSKKVKINQPAEGPKVAEQTISETSQHTPSDDPPLETLNISVDPMGIDPPHTEPPSTIMPTEEAKAVIVTGTG